LALAAFMGANILAEATKEPRWHDNIRGWTREAGSPG